MICRPLGDTTGWVRWYASPADVYLWRALAPGAVLESAADAALVLRAVAKGQQLKLDAKAIVVGGIGSPSPTVDVVLTADSKIPYAVPDTASVVASRAAADSSLRQRMPNVEFVSPEFLTLVAPLDALDFWKAHVTVWDDQVGPTAAFAAGQGVYVGTADDGPRVKPWAPAPPPDLNGKKNGKSGGESQLGAVASFVAWAAVGAAAAWLGAHLIFAREQVK